MENSMDIISTCAFAHTYSATIMTVSEEKAFRAGLGKAPTPSSTLIPLVVSEESNTATKPGKKASGHQGSK